MVQVSDADSTRRRRRFVRRLSAGLVTGAVALSGGLAAAVVGDDPASGAGPSDTGTGTSTGSDSQGSTPVQLAPGSGDDHAATGGS